MSAIVRTAALVPALAAALWAAAAVAAEPPEPPCAGAPAPVAPGPEAPPKVLLWHAADLPEGWQPPACSGITTSESGVVVALAGSFHHNSDARDVLARFGAISTHTGMLYWNTSDAAWRPEVVEASALAGPDPETKRPDFTPDELHAGATLYVLYDDDGAPGPVVFASEIRSAGPDGFVLVSRNVTALRLMGVSIADPGQLSSMLEVRRVGPDLFTYYSLSSLTLSSLAAVMVSDSAHINRAVGSFRFLAGIPGDLEPPAARE